MTEELPYTPFKKIPRLSRMCFITEKIDGTNAQVYISDDLSVVRAGSKNRWITPKEDNYGFASWVAANEKELLKLGPGSHYGEWWGVGINRGYGLFERRFSLFNVDRWSDENIRPACCGVVPVLEIGIFTNELVDQAVRTLTNNGSAAAPGYMNPEGIVVYHTAANAYFKKTLVDDEQRKGDGVPRERIAKAGR